MVIGAVGGACVMLARLAAPADPAGTSWLMVLLQVAVAAQGGAAMLWVMRGALRWTVGRVTGSHAVREAYAQGDTLTYAVFLLTLATALGVQLVVPVLTVLAALFVGAQWWVLRAARRLTRPRPRDTGQRDAASHRTAAMAGASGGALMLSALTGERLLTQTFGSSAGLNTLYTAAVLAGLGTGVMAAGLWKRRIGVRASAVFALLQGAVGVWGLLSPTVLPAIAAPAATASGTRMLITLFAVVGLPAFFSGSALSCLALEADGARLDGGGVGQVGVAALFGAASASVLAVDVLFAFTGVRGVTWVAATASLGVAAAAMMTRRRATAPAEHA